MSRQGDRHGGNAERCGQAAAEPGRNRSEDEGPEQEAARKDRRGEAEIRDLEKLEAELDKIANKPRGTKEQIKSASRR